MGKFRTRRALAALTLAAIAPTFLAACGDDDDTSTDDESSEDIEAAGGDLEAYCEATAEIEMLPEPDIDFENATPEEIAEGVKAYAGSQMRPIADRIVEAAPEEVADDIAVLSGAVDVMVESGDFESAFGSDGVEEAGDRAHAFDLENCGWQEQEVKAVDYAFEGVPDTLEAGRTSFELTNAGTEAHEAIVLRKNDGETLSFEEIFALGEEEGQSKVTFVADNGAPPGEDEYAVADLTPGEYAVVCFIPVGSVGEAEGDGPPHFTQGMVSTFNVE